MAEKMLKTTWQVSFQSLENVLRLELPKERKLIFLGVSKKVQGISGDVLIDRLCVIVHLRAR